MRANYTLSVLVDITELQLPLLSCSCPCCPALLYTNWLFCWHMLWF